MDEKLTPTHKKIGVHLDRVFDEIRPELHSGEDLSLDQLKSIFSVAILHGKESLDVSIGCLNSGIEIFKIISEENPYIAQAVNAGLLNIAMAIINTTNEVACEAISREVISFRPLAAKNSAKLSATERAKSVARELWSADIEKSIRIGDMADRVYRTLASEGLQDALPETVDRVKEWIKPVAPEYARKGGRRRKSS